MAALPSTVQAVPTECFGETPTKRGTNRGETVLGTLERDVIVAMGGGDTVRGVPRGAESTVGDLLCGNGGNDQIMAAEGPDYLHGSYGVDSLFGGAGNDFLYGGPLEDSNWGEDGNDYVFGHGSDDYLAGNGGYDWIDGGPGFDYCWVDSPGGEYEGGGLQQNCEIWNAEVEDLPPHVLARVMAMDRNELVAATPDVIGSMVAHGTIDNPPSSCVLGSGSNSVSFSGIVEGAIDHVPGDGGDPQIPIQLSEALEWSGSFECGPQGDGDLASFSIAGQGGFEFTLEYSDGFYFGLDHIVFPEIYGTCEIPSGSFGCSLSMDFDAVPLGDGYWIPKVGAGKILLT